jgi:hypothetical protein
VLVFIPFFILISAAIAVIILSFVPRGTGIAWLVSVLASIGAWITAMVIKSSMPLTFSGHMFLDLGIQNITPAFQLDIINWPIVVSICSVVAGVLIVSSARIGLDSNYWEWAVILGLGALGALGSMASNIFTTVLILGLFDTVELFTVFYTSKYGWQKIDHLRYSLWSFLSLFLFISAYAWQSSSGGVMDDWKSMMPGPGGLILAGCMTRMILVPYKRITGYSYSSTNGLLITRFIINLLISAVIVLQMPVLTGTSTGKNLVILYMFLVALTSAVWIFQNKTEDQPTAWRVFAGSMIFAEYLYGFSASGFYFTITVISLFQMLLLIYPTSRFTRVLGLLAIIGFSGIPFTPNNSGLAGFIRAGSIPGFIFLIPAIMVFYSSLKNLWQKASLENPMEERWARYLSQSGLLIALINPWLIAVIWLPDAMRLNISIPAMIMTIAGTSLFLAEKTRIIDFKEIVVRIKTLTDRLIKGKTGELLKILSTANVQSELIQKPYNFFVNLFEGDGGVIWAILCLVLVITVLSSLGSS